MDRTDVADVIERFLADEVKPWEWDDFISVPLNDPELEEIRQRATGLPTEFPPERAGEYCGDGGAAVLRQYAERLRRSPKSRSSM